MAAIYTVAGFLCARDIIFSIAVRGAVSKYFHRFISKLSLFTTKISVTDFIEILQPHAHMPFK
jgi:hypothetical protein